MAEAGMSWQPDGPFPLENNSFSWRVYYGVEARVRDTVRHVRWSVAGGIRG